MDRPTQELKAGEHTLIVKTYATAREHQLIQKTLLSSTKFEVSGETPRMSDFDASVIFDMHAELIRQMVVSLDGSEEKIVERCLDLPSEDFDTIVDTLDQLVSKKKK